MIFSGTTIYIGSTANVRPQGQKGATMTRKKELPIKLSKAKSQPRVGTKPKPSLLNWTIFPNYLCSSTGRLTKRTHFKPNQCNLCEILSSSRAKDCGFDFLQNKSKSGNLNYEKTKRSQFPLFSAQKQGPSKKRTRFLPSVALCAAL
jgi:hypothetical protein